MKGKAYIISMESADNEEKLGIVAKPELTDFYFNEESVDACFEENGDMILVIGGNGWPFEFDGKIYGHFLTKFR